MLLRQLLSVTVAVISNVFAIPFPNDIIGVPDVTCEPTLIMLKVKTTAGNPSHMFVANFLEDPACVTRNTNKIIINHDACGLTRERTVNPPGVIYRVCVAIQLHPQFVTKVDRTFCAQCVYMEAVKELDRTLAVSAQGTTEVPVTFEMPTCSYTIRRGAQDGDEIHYATVGETVFHVWKCPSEVNGMLVQNCYVEDGQGNRILIVDQNGCGVDQYIMQTPIYSEDLTMAFQESHVFKFADKTITRFTCQIKLCIIAGGGCEGVTPPLRCPPSGVAPAPVQPYKGKKKLKKSRLRKTRSVIEQLLDEVRSKRDIKLISNTTIANEEEDDYQMDVTGEIRVLDSLQDAQYYDQRLNEATFDHSSNRAEIYVTPDAVCIPRLGFQGMVVIMGTLCATITLTIMACLVRQRIRAFSKSQQHHHHPHDYYQ